MNNRVLVGLILMLAGVFFLFNPGGNWDAGTVFGLFWPSIFVIPFSLFFHWLYFFMLNRRGVGLLVPGGILLTVGIVCQIGMLFDNWGSIWPGFILAPAVGLFELYWFGSKNRWLLVPITILTGLSLIFFTAIAIGSLFSQTIFGKPVIAIVLILIGLIVIFSRKGNNGSV